MLRIRVGGAEAHHRMQRFYAAWRCVIQIAACFVGTLFSESTYHCAFVMDARGDLVTRDG